MMEFWGTIVVVVAGLVLFGFIVGVMVATVSGIMQRLVLRWKIIRFDKWVLAGGIRVAVGIGVGVIGVGVSSWGVVWALEALTPHPGADSMAPLFFIWVMICLSIIIFVAVAVITGGVTDSTIYWLILRRSISAEPGCWWMVINMVAWALGVVVGWFGAAAFGFFLLIVFIEEADSFPPMGFLAIGTVGAAVLIFTWVGSGTITWITLYIFNLIVVTISEKVRNSTSFSQKQISS